MLAELKFKCRYNDGGCQDEIEYSKIFEHEAKCSFALIKCKGSAHGCQISLVQNEMAAHEA